MIAFSSDDAPEQSTILTKLACNYHSKDFILRSPLDLYLRETVGSWSIEPSPSAVIAIYNKPFRDLKIIAEIKKIPEYQWIPVFIIVKEKLRNLRLKFLEVGVTEVIEKPDTQKQLLDLIDLLLKKYSSKIMMVG
jgi:CheY-like chemotaxis protein